MNKRLSNGLFHRPSTRVAGMVLLAVGALLLASCGNLANKSSSSGSNTGNGDYVIGLAAAMTGDFAQIGEDTQRGAQLAIDEVNKSGGFAGHPGKLVVEDTAGKPASGVNAVARLTQSSGINFLLGPDLSTVTLAALDTSKAAKIPQMTSSISPDIMKDAGQWLFRARPSDATNVKIMVRYGVDKLKLKRIAVLYSLDAYGQGALPVIQSAAKEFNANVVVTKGVTPGSKDMTSQIAAAKGAQADGILWWGLIPESAVLEKAVKQFGFDGPVFGANALVNTSTLGLAGDAANGVIAATTFANSDPDPKAQAFLKKFQAVYGAVPNDHAPLYYDMVKAVADATNSAKSTDPAKVRDALRKLSHEGTTGTMKWDANGEYDSLSAVLVKVENGKPVVIGRSQ